MPLRRSDDTAYTLASNLSASGAAVQISGGEYMFFCEGTATGSTLSLQIQSPNGTWMDVAAMAGNVVKTTTLPYSVSQIDLPTCKVRLAATSGTPTGLYAYLVGLG